MEEHSQGSGNIDVGLADLGARIISDSSCLDQKLASSNILSKDQKLIWNSKEGLPQFIVLALDELTLNYSFLHTVGFYCWHDYYTNPKTIEMWVAEEQQDQNLIHWADFSLKMQKGRQFFHIHPLPEAYKIIKFVITQTFGEFQTYLNKVYLMAEPFPLHSRGKQVKQLELEDLDSIERYSEKMNSFKNSPSRTLNRKLKRQGSYEKPIAIKTEEEHFQFTEEELLEEQSKEERRRLKSNAQAVRHLRNQQQSGNFLRKPAIQLQQSQQSQMKQHQQKSQSQQLEQEFYEDEESSLNKNIALLTLSKQVIEMDEKIQYIQRRVDVLDIKVSLSHQNLEERIMGRVEEIIEEKIARHLSLRNLVPNHEANQNQSQKVRMAKHLFFKEEKGTKQRPSDIESDRTKPVNRIKQSSTSNAHTHANSQSNRLLPKNTSSNPSRDSRKTSVVELMNRLAQKMKERSQKVRKLELRQKKEKRKKP